MPHGMELGNTWVGTMRGLISTIAALLLSAAALAEEPALSIERQGSFFVGGREVRSETLSTIPAFAAKGTVTVDQLYVRYQLPPGSAQRPALTLIHGCCLTGKTWETTPDGRMGWDEYLVRKGYGTYVIDQAWRGRSAGEFSAINAVRQGAAPADRLPVLISAGHEAAWPIFRFGTEYPTLNPGLQFPVAALDEFWKQMVPDAAAGLPVPTPTVAGLAALATRLERTVLISHSQSGIYPFQVVTGGARGVAGIVALEPGSCPAAAADMAPFKSVPILVMFGDFVPGSAWWAPRLAACRDFVAAANAAGGRATLIVLPDRGIHGNSHMFMQDQNNLQVADVMLDWIAATVTR